VIVLDVLGVPAPKGSSRAILIAGQPRLVPSSSDANAREQKRWRKAIEERVALALGPRPELKFREVPLQVELVFRVERPGGHYGTGRNAGVLKPSAPTVPIVYPDIDKLARCTLDALTGLVFDDDSRIVRLIVNKVYATKGNEGARIVIQEWSEDHDTLQAVRSQQDLFAKGSVRYGVEG
jgi:Holliday junction resolvase RusA-like endonuclease